MGAHRGDIRPLLDKDEAVGLLDIDMAAMPQTPGLAARSRAMLGAERDHAFAMLGGQDDVAGDDDHYGMLFTEMSFTDLRRGPTVPPSAVPRASSAVLLVSCRPFFWPRQKFVRSRVQHDHPRSAKSISQRTAP